MAAGVDDSAGSDAGADDAAGSDAGVDDAGVDDAGVDGAGGDAGGHVDEQLDALITSADLDGLVRLVDARCAAADWAGLLHLRDRSRWAVSTGRQLWPAATLAEYRLALLAPAEWAAKVLDEDTGRFSIGPLTEVIAQSHSWASLAPLLPTGPRAAFVAHERVIRGEVIDATELPDVLEMPFALQPWEPEYPVAVYTADAAQFEAPSLPSNFVNAAARPGESIESIESIDDDDVSLAVRQLVEAWTAESNGTADVICVEGDASDAVAALGVPKARMYSINAAHALQWLTWAGASGGAFGRRRGTAVGRFGAWWLVAALGGVSDDWPIDVEVLGALVNELQWYWWDAGEPPLGWQLHIAVELPSEHLAWAISANDAT